MHSQLLCVLVDPCLVCKYLVRYAYDAVLFRPNESSSILGNEARHYKDRASIDKISLRSSLGLRSLINQEHAAEYIETTGDNAAINQSRCLSGNIVVIIRRHFYDSRLPPFSAPVSGNTARRRVGLIQYVTQPQRLSIINERACVRLLPSDASWWASRILTTAHRFSYSHPMECTTAVVSSGIASAVTVCLFAP